MRLQQDGRLGKEMLAVDVSHGKRPWSQLKLSTCEWYSTESFPVSLRCCYGSREPCLRLDFLRLDDDCISRDPNLEDITQASGLSSLQSTFPGERYLRVMKPYQRKGR